MEQQPATVSLTETHPCYSANAHHHFARLHLPVSPSCNVQCNYCNRKYDCSNESRPGVTSVLLKPEEALKKVYHAAGKMRELSVIGIAGPGDSLANPARAFRTLSLVKEKFPDLHLCLSTNGLALPDNIETIERLGIKHVTVTLNTMKPETAMRIYDWVLFDKKKSRSLEAMKWFLSRQQEGVRAIAAKGVMVKVNSVLIPGINDAELPDISKKLKLMGVFVHNIMPLNARPEHGTVFGLQGRAEPTSQMLEAVRGACGDIKQMGHCRQCRADASGLLGDEAILNNEVVSDGSPSGENFAEKRKNWREKVIERYADKPQTLPAGRNGVLVAALTKGKGLVNLHFGHAKEFHIFRVAGGRAELINVRKVPEVYCGGKSSCGDGEKLLEGIIDTIGDCSAVVCLKAGYGPYKRLLERGILPVTELPFEPIGAAAIKAGARVAEFKTADLRKEAACESNG